MTEEFKNKLIDKLRECLKREPTEKEKGNVLTDYVIVQQVLIDENEAKNDKIKRLEDKLKL